MCIRDSSATASLPCIRTIFSLILDLLYCERKVRTMLDTHLAADAVLRVDDCVPVITVYLKDLLRAYGDADTAVFAPLRVVLDLECSFLRHVPSSRVG